jgi:hypothetical protein
VVFATTGQYVTGLISANGNVTGGNLVTGGAISGLSVDVTAFINAGTVISAAGNITGANVFTGGLVSATANITGGNVLTGGLISATGNITGGNISTAGQFGAASLSASGNVTGGNINTGGLISATGDIFASAVSAATIGNAGATINGTTISASGNITIGNVLTGGQVSATGNITGGNVNTNNIVGTTISITGNSIALIATTGNIDVNSRNINNLATPVADSDAANKSYVDSVAQGLDPKASVVYASANALPAYTYNNGASGVGATITANAVGALSIDSSTPSQGARVLIKNETSTNQPYNGIYTVTTVGSGAAAFVLRGTTFSKPGMRFTTLSIAGPNSASVTALVPKSKV